MKAIVISSKWLKRDIPTITIKADYICNWVMNKISTHRYNHCMKIAASTRNITQNLNIKSMDKFCEKENNTFSRQNVFLGENLFWLMRAWFLQKSNCSMINDARPVLDSSEISHFSSALYSVKYQPLQGLLGFWYVSCVFSKMWFKCLCSVWCDNWVNLKHLFMHLFSSDYSVCSWRGKSK